MKNLMVTTSLVAFVLNSAGAAAQSINDRGPSAIVDGASPDQGGDEGVIIVTAQKRKENVQRVGIAVTALDDITLRSMNVSTAKDLTAQVPSLQSSNPGQLVVTYNIRGVSQNSYSDHLEPPVAVYIDDAYLATLSTGGQPVFDLERVEVLKGPQGTLFGRNATGGLVRFVTKAPTKYFEGYVNVTAGEYSKTRVEAAVGGPLAENLRVRLAGDLSRENGYIKVPAGGPNNTPAGRSLGSNNYRAARATLVWEPSEALSVSLQGRYTDVYDGTGSPYIAAATVPGPNGLGRFVRPDENPYGTGLGCGPSPTLCYTSPGKYTSYLNTSGNYASKWYGGTLKADLVLDDLVLTSVTDWQRHTKRFGEDCDGTPFEVCFDGHTTKLNQFSQELRGIYTRDELSLTAGLYYLQFNTDSFTQYTILGGYNTFKNDYVKNKSGSAFIQAEYGLTPQLTAIGGLRYTKDKKDATYTLADDAGTPAFLFDKASHPGLANQTYTMVSAKAGLQYQVDSNLMLYASYNRGTKSGGFEFPGFFPVDVASLTYGNETLHAFEIGEKATLFNRKVRLNTSIFYYDYKGYHAYFFIPIPNGFVQSIANRNARVYGLESEINIRPIDGLTANFGVSLLRTKVFGLNLLDGTIVDRKLPQAPKFSANMLLRYEHAVGTSGLILSEQFDMNYKGAHGLSVLGGETEREAHYAVGNIQIALRPESDRWQVGAYVRNLWNERYRAFTSDLSSLGVMAQAYARPRSIGGFIRVNF